MKDIERLLSDAIDRNKKVETFLEILDCWDHFQDVLKHQMKKHHGNSSADYELLIEGDNILVKCEEYYCGDTDYTEFTINKDLLFSVDLMGEIKKQEEIERKKAEAAKRRKAAAQKTAAIKAEKKKLRELLRKYPDLKEG